jgi:hypothetical protein
MSLFEAVGAMKAGKLARPVAWRGTTAWVEWVPPPRPDQGFHENCRSEKSSGQ